MSKMHIHIHAREYSSILMCEFDRITVSSSNCEQELIIAGAEVSGDWTSHNDDGDE
jgi:hypothetical protein